MPKLTIKKIESLIKRRQFVSPHHWLGRLLHTARIRSHPIML